MINGVTELIMMKADVLDTFEKIYVCTHYNYQGELIDYMPYEIITNKPEPVLKEMEGWNQDLTGIRSKDEIPAALQNYINYLEQELNVPIKYLSVGPDRTQTIVL